MKNLKANPGDSENWGGRSNLHILKPTVADPENRLGSYTGNVIFQVSIFRAENISFREHGNP